MSRLIKLKNNTVSTLTIQGWEILSQAYLSLDPTDFADFANDLDVFDKVGSGDLIVNDGDSDLTAIAGWNHILGSTITISQTSEVGHKKLWVHQSPKPEVDGKHFFSQWTGRGDNMTTGELGGGNQCIIETIIGVVDAAVDIELYNIGSDVYIHEGYAMWDGASFGDCFSAYVMARATPLQTAANLDYIIDSEHRIKYIGAGAGTHGFAATPVLVPSYTQPVDGFWNYNTTTGLTYAPAQDGAYNMYDIEIAVNSFIHHVPVSGSTYSYMRLASSDVSKLPEGYFLRIETHNNSDTVWKLMFMITTFREKTINTIHD